MQKCLVGVLRGEDTISILLRLQITFAKFVAFNSMENLYNLHLIFTKYIWKSPYLTQNIFVI